MEKDGLKWKPKEAGVAILTGDKRDFKMSASRVTEGLYITTKGPARQENVTAVHVRAPHGGAPRCMKRISRSEERQTGAQS